MAINIRTILTKLKSSDFLDTLLFHYLIIGCGFIVSVLYARFLGPEKRGIFEAIFLWRILIMSFSLIGLDHATIYFSAKYKNEPEVVFFNAFMLRGLLILFAILVGYFVILPAVQKHCSPETLYLSRLVLVAGFLEIFLIAFFVLRGLGEFKTVNRLQMIPDAATLAGLVIIYFFSRVSLYDIVLIRIGVLVLYNCVCLWRYSMHYRLKSKIDIFLCKRILIYGAKNLLNMITNTINLHMDKAIIALFLLPKELGYYSVAVAVSGGILPIASASSKLLFTRVAMSDRSEHSNTLFARSLGLTTLLVGLAIVMINIILSYFIEFFYTKEFIKATLPCRVLIIASFFLSINIVLQSALKGLNFPEGVFYGQLIGTVITALGLYFLVPPFGINGAAGTSLLAYSSTTICLMYLINKKTGVSFKNLLLKSKAETAILIRNRILTIHKP